MRKYVLVALIGLIAMNVMAGKNYVAQVKECDDYWKPIIKDIKDTRKRLQDEWDSLAPWEQKNRTGLNEMMGKLCTQQCVAEDAKDLCYSEGLEESKEYYERQLR